MLKRLLIQKNITSEKSVTLKETFAKHYKLLIRRKLYFSFKQNQSTLLIQLNNKEVVAQLVPSDVTSSCTDPHFDSYRHQSFFEQFDK